jgi:hypothetical protein
MGYDVWLLVEWLVQLNDYKRDESPTGDIVPGMTRHRRTAARYPAPDMNGSGEKEKRELEVFS